MSFNRLFKGLTLLFVSVNVLLISGCTQLDMSKVSQIASTKPPVVQQSAWQKRQLFLKQRSSWGLGSKVSLRFDEENVIFGLNWQQGSTSNYVIQINNPITGALVSKLTRSKGSVSLLADNGQTFKDTDEERLLKSQTGLNIPLKGMQYWVRGLTSPQYKLDTLKLDNAGRPLIVEQAGWKITYTGYEDNSTNALPKKINLNRGAEKIFIRLIAKSWN